MRSLAVVLVVMCGAMPALASRKLTLAVAPLKGDTGDTIGKAIVDALAGKDFKVTDLHDTQAAIVKLKISGDPEGKSLTKLEAELEVDVVVFGKVTGSGKKRTVHLKLARGKEVSTLNLPLRSVTETWSKQVHDEVVANVGGAPDEPVAEDKPKHHEDEDKPKHHEDEDKPKHHDDEDKPKKRVADEDKPRHGKPEVAATDDDGDGTTSVRKKHHHVDDNARRPGGGDLQLDAGLAFGQRHLSYSVSAQDNVPPTVGTGAASLRVEGEVYPFALSNASSGLANVGLAATFDKTVGLSITVPNTTNSASIDQAHFSIGGRYRMNVGEQSTLVLGLDYADRFFLADRSALTSPVQLDAPDVDYKAIEPNASLRIPFTPEIVGFADLGALLILSAGPIQKIDSYGPATVFGGDLAIGATYAVSKTLAVKVTGELNLISLSFKGTGEMATAREVTGAMDRTLGLSAMLAYMY